jgi:hypothetical protein
MNPKYIEINKLSHLHNGSTIFFCKTDYLFSEFQNIAQQKNNIILISGNSDYSITDEILDIAPKNIKKWYAQNALSNNPILEPIPIGLENKLPSSREGHGVGYFDRASLKESLLEKTNLNNKKPTKFIYANFNINTNPSYRALIKEMCQKANFIDWEEPKLSLGSFFDQVSQYKMIVCPAGNGLDTHRLWETLYCNRIPITFKIASYKLYELYSKLPIIILENNTDLMNYELIEEKYLECINKKYDLSILDINFLINKIEKEQNAI